MSITTYAELQTATADWLARSDLSAAVPDFITIGEKWIFRHARTRDMEAALSFTITAGVGAVPTDFLEIKHARIDGTPTRHLKVRDTRWIMEQYPNRSSTSKPSYIGVDGATFIFGPYADADYSVLGIYYAKPVVVASANNAVFLANPDLYLYAALCAAEGRLKNDTRLAFWKQQRLEILADMTRDMKAGQYDTAMEVRVA